MIAAMEHENFYQYWKSLSPAEKNALAEKAETSFMYLSQLANGHRRPGLNVILRLQKADPNLTVEFMIKPITRAA